MARKLLMIILAGGMALGLAACGSDPGTRAVTGGLLGAGGGGAAGAVGGAATAPAR